MRPSSECFYVGGRSIGAGTTQETECGELFVTRIHHMFDVVPPPLAPLTQEAPGGNGGLRQWPPPALLTADPFVPAQNTTTCTMWPLGKAATASGKAADGTHRGRPMRRLKGSSATQLPGAPRDLTATQAVSGLARRREETAAPPAAQETAVLGSEGRLQLATVVSMATLAAPLSPSTGTTLSAQYKKHDSK